MPVLVSYLKASTSIDSDLFPKGFSRISKLEKRNLYQNGNDLSLMMCAVITRDSLHGNMGRLRALPIHGLVIYQNIFNKKNDQVTTLIRAGRVSAQFQGTTIRERLVECV